MASDVAGAGNPTQESDTVVSVGERIECPYFRVEDSADGTTLFCTKFQIKPLCTGDVNKCDVLMYAPDPRDGYR